MSAPADAASASPSETAESFADAYDSVVRLQHAALVGSADMVMGTARAPLADETPVVPQPIAPAVAQRPEPPSGLLPWAPPGDDDDPARTSWSA